MILNNIHLGTNSLVGVVELTESYHVSVADELIISPCTSKNGFGTRIFNDGRILIEGTSTCPVILSALSSGLHEGIQFNASSSVGAR